MALLDMFKKKDAPQAQGTPIEQVLAMQQQGLTNNQIVQALQRQGYDTANIMDALSQAEAKHGVEPFTPMPEEHPSFNPQSQPQPARTEAFEEIAEHIVDEKWQEFVKEMGKMAEWKDQVNSRLDRLEQSMTDVKGDLDNLHRSILGKIGEYDKNLLDVGTEIKAMEKVFQKVLPTLTENVAELSRVTKIVKGPVKK
jgi:uncharacterized protein YhaN